ncbi:hypothetical protein INR49_001712 [Caranx melampygus]|nr:hypothetical protein INR49_001712 [Caranx melampygus]
MGDPATLVESSTPTVVTAIPTAIAGETQDGAKTQSANKNGKKADSGSSGSFFTWFIVLALLGVWTSVAVVYFDLVDYQGVLDKAKGLQINLSEALQGLTSEGDGQGESEVLDWLEEVEEGGSDWFNGFVTFLYGLINPLEPVEEEDLSASGEVVEMQEDDEEDEDERGIRRRGAKDDGNQGQKIVIVLDVNISVRPTLCPQNLEKSSLKDAGRKLREALKQQLAIIHERVEAKKLAKMALAEVRQLLAKEEEEKALELGRKEIMGRVKDRVAARLKEEEEKMEKEEMEKAVEKLQKARAKQKDEQKEESEEEEEKSKKGEKEKSEKKVEGEGKKAQEDKGRGKETTKEKKNKSKAEKSDKGKK